jgi:hypothetical protein
MGGTTALSGSVRITDILSTLQNAVTAAQSLANSFNRSPFIGGVVVTNANNLSTTAVQVVSAGSSRVHLTFHNPGAVTAFVYPVSTVSASTVVPVSSSPGGSFQIFGGAYFSVFDGANSAWMAFSSSGSANPLTVIGSS